MKFGTDRSIVDALCVIGFLAMACSNARGQAPRIAVIGDNTIAESVCTFFESDGYDCDNLPWTGPKGSLDSYRVVVHLGVWSDPDHLLADFMRAGKGVITWVAAPDALGINTDPIVQDWIGANVYAAGTDRMLTVATDSILGDLPVGTSLLLPNDGLWPGLDDTTGHPGAKVLARFLSGTDVIGVMRNDWEGGTSVYFSDSIWPDTAIDKSIILNAMHELAPLPVPAVSDWGLAVTALLTLTAGSVFIRRRPGIA